MRDPFQIFGVPPKFNLDVDALERRHRELSRALHPDRHTSSSAGERREALNRAIEVNSAWRQLRDPVSRAEALLQTLGLQVEEGREPKPDPALLMEIMEQREELSDARRARDGTRVTRLAERARVAHDQLVQQLAVGFEQVSASHAAHDQNREPLLKKLGALRYYRRFLEEARAIQDEIG